MIAPLFSLVTWLGGLGLLVSSVVCYAALRRRAAEAQALAKKLSREIEQRCESDERYSLLTDHAPDAIVTVDCEGRFTSINPHSERITGWSRDAWMRQSFISLVHPEDATKARAAFETALRGKKPPLTEIRVLDKSGGPVLMEFTIAPHLRHNRVGSVLVIGRDISARRRAEQAQAGLEVQLRRAQKMEALGRLAGGIAHDFNNFLTVIVANCQMARATLVNGHPAVESLEEIDRAGHHAAELVRQILAFSRPQKQDRQVHQLEPVVKDAVRLLRSMLPPIVKIETRLAPDCAPVLANSEQINQILLNLGTNAAYAMRGKGGSIEVALGPVRVDEALTARNPDLRSGPYVCLTVSDEGHGMDSAMLERIFDPFFTTKPPGEGTGLGLAVVHGIMKNHEGAISVYSEPGRGTRFNLYFPASPDVNKRTNQLAQAAPRGQGQRLLFVDDETALTEIAKRLLETLGYRVTICHSAAEALALMQQTQERFECVISDLAMPGMNGLELARECQRLQPGVPFILTSGNNSVLTADSLRACGVCAFILKPFTLQAVAQALDRALSARSAPCP